MKGPSLEAIRKFKEAQEKKKVQEDERRIQEKLSTLSHRAAQGDRKAKSTLIKIEKLEKDKALVDNISRNQNPSKQSGPSSSNQIKQDGIKTMRGLAQKPKAAEFNFDDLMKIAKQNNNQMGKPEATPVPKEEPAPVVIKKKLRTEPRLIVSKPPQMQQKIGVAPRLPARVPNQAVSSKTVVASANNKLIGRRISTPSRSLAPEPAGRRDAPHRKNPIQIHNVVRKAPISMGEDHRMSADEIRQERQMAMKLAVARYKAKLNQRSNYYGDEDEKDEDDYEDDDDDLDDFVVDEEEDDYQDEVRKTIKSVFKYDKRRCDRREEELDRQYRAIGRVNTFEDLEREEKRASRIAAMEDAKEQREEEERKRKKAKLKKHG